MAKKKQQKTNDRHTAAPDLSRQLITAVRDTDCSSEYLEGLLARSDYADEAHRRALDNALRISSEKGLTWRVALLLKYGADCNVRYSNGTTPLMVANNADIVTLLLNYGATKNAQQEIKQVVPEGQTKVTYDKTALMLCIEARRTEAARALIEGGVHLEVKDREGSTALMYALRHDDTDEITNLLILQGADIEAQDRQGRTVLIIAASKNRAAAVAMLVQRGVNVNRTDTRGWNVVHHIAVDKDRAKVHAKVPHNLEQIDIRDRALKEELAKIDEQQPVENSERMKRRAQVRADIEKRTHALLDERKKVDSDYSLFLAQERRIFAALRSHNPPQPRVNFDGRDKLDRTPLHCASTVGNYHVAQMLLDGCDVDTHATEHRLKTALHLAVANLHLEIVELLLGRNFRNMPLSPDRRANPNAESDGGWTSLHNACAAALRTADNAPLPKPSGDTNKAVKRLSAQPAVDDPAKEHARLVDESNAKVIRIVDVLWAHGADLNRKTHGGKMPLHVAAEGGSTTLVSYLLANGSVKRNARDAFGNTALLCAAKMKHLGIVKLFAPANHASALSDDARKAMEGFEATCVTFKDRHKEPHRPQRRDTLDGEELGLKGGVRERSSVYDLLYSEKPVCPPAVAHRDNSFRWIHLPANNVPWCQDLLTKWFVEQEGEDHETFKALERSFDHEHRGQEAHSRSLRPVCEIVPRASRRAELPTEESRGLGIPQATDELSESNASFEVAAPMTDPFSTPSSNKRTPRTHVMKEVSKVLPSKGSPSDGAQMPAVDKTSLAARKDTSDSSPSTKRQDYQSPGNNMYVFVPFLHFESDGARRDMQEEVRRTWNRRRRKSIIYQDDEQARHVDHHTYLVRADLNGSNAALHIRRTLDQSFYRSIDTADRDRDQVVWRYQRHLRIPKDERKVVMVDQLWMWIVGRDLIITSFPQRWHQPRDDRLNVLESVVADINAPTRQAVQNVYELAVLIASRCCQSFSRYGEGSDEVPFLDMFETSIGIAMEKETRLFKSFRAASRKASRWLRHNRISHGRRDVHGHQEDHNIISGESTDEEDETPTSSAVSVGEPDSAALLDIGPETRLLKEIKDIQDELAMLGTVFEHQRRIVDTMKDSLAGVGTQPGRKPRGQYIRVTKPLEDQRRHVDHSLRDIDRMTLQVGRIYDNITKLLDLKQKHANAIEALFARDQAEDTAQQARDTAMQGKTLMVFTTVSVIFLPLSFIASFFAISIKELPHVGENQELSLHYVASFVFGVGLSVAGSCVIMALYLDPLLHLFREVSRKIRGHSAGGHKEVDTHAGQELNRNGRQRRGSLFSTFSSRLSTEEVAKVLSRESRWPKDEEAGAASSVRPSRPNFTQRRNVY